MYKYKLIFFLIYSNLLIAQSKIKCDLYEITNLAFNKNQTIKRSYQSIKNAEGDLLIQNSVFDYKILSELSYQNNKYKLFNYDPRNEYLDKFLKSNNVSLTAGIEKKIRSGQIINIDLQYSFDNNNYPFNEFNQQISPFFGNHSSLVNIAFLQPILRGSGKKVSTLMEKSSEKYIESSKSSFEFTNSSEVLKIAIAYWQYYSASKNLEIYKENETRVRSVLEMTKELVKADKTPEGDLAQINADLSNQERLTQLAQQNLYSAKINLGRSIGLTDNESTLLDEPLNSFPTLENEFNLLNKEDLIQTALSNRADIKGVEQIYEAIKMQYELAEDNKKPQLDFTGFVFYGSSSNGNGIDQVFNSFINNQGRNIGGGAKITFSFPINNNLAKGNLAKMQANIDDQTIVKEDLIRNIKLNVDNSYSILENNITILKKAEESLKYYQEAYNNEKAKFQSGLTTLLNLILFQERLTYSQIEYLQANQNFAISIANLRHETGTLISQKENGFLIKENAFYNIID